MVSIYSLVQENKFFTSLADLECSVLKFTDEILEGENIKYPPYWAGIDKIRTILGQISSKVDVLKLAGIPTSFNQLKSDVNLAKTQFRTTLKNAGDTIQSTGYKDSTGNYQLDLAYQFGTFDDNTNTAPPEKSVCHFWINEYDSLATDSEGEMDETITNFGPILSDSSITTSLSSAKTKLGEIKEEFKILKNLVADYILEKADKIDKTGHVIYALFFSLLVIFCVAIIVFMLLLCCCSGEVCTNLTCFQYFFKYILHIFWNIMALFMLILFFGGSWFTLAGVVGNDLAGVISFLISEDNLGADKDTIILDNVKQYLNKCFNGDGNILTELGFSSDMDNFELLKENKLKIEEIQNQFNDKLQKFVFTEYLEQLNNRANFISDEFKLIATSSSTTPTSYNFKELLDQINTHSETNSKNEKWSITSTSTELCSSTTPTNEIIYHPKNCYPSDQSWVQTELSSIKTILDDMRTLIGSATDTTNTNSIISLLGGLNTKYYDYLQSEISFLGVFLTKIKEITDIVKDYTSEDDKLFSFMNCNFAKENVEVVLHNLKNSFGNDVYEIGVYLLIAAFSMPIAISFTILLIVISNEEIEKNKEIFSKKNEENKRKSLKNNAKNNAKNNVNNINNDITMDNKNEGNITEQRKLNEKDEKIY